MSVAPPLPQDPDPGRPGFAPKGDRRFAIALLLGGVACLGMGQTIVFAVLPPLARRLGLADIQVAAIFMMSAMFWVALSPRWGRRSDNFGRKPFILTGLLGFAVSTTLFATSIRIGLAGAMTGLGLYALIVGTRSIYGIIGSATPAAAQGYIADRTPPERRTAGVSSFSAAFGLGAMVGPGLGGAVAAIGPLAPLYAVAALAGAMAIVILFFLPEKTAPAPKAPRLRLSPLDARLRPFLVFGLGIGMVNAVPIQTTTFYFMDTLHLTPDEAPQYAGAGLMGLAMASLFAQVVLVQRLRLQPHLLMRIAPALLAAGHGLIAISSQFGLLVFGLVVAGLGAGMALPGFTGAAMLAVGMEEQGAAAGLANSASASGFIFSPVVAFTLYSLAPQAPYMLTAALATSLLAFALWNAKIRNAGRFEPGAVNP